MSKGIRKEIFDIVLYSSGAFNISELWNVPLGYLKEITQAIIDKNEKEKQALDKAKGISSTMF
jgi:hypothetical protein